MSPFLTPTSNLMDVSTFPMMILTVLFLYMHLIVEHSLGCAPYFPSMEISNAWLEESKTFIRSANAAHVVRLWLCLRCIRVLIVMCYLDIQL